jgi:Putative MetA-pathway of phenol degradation
MRISSLNPLLSHVLTLFIILVPHLALAGPPFLTDDPEPVEYQHHEFYIATQQTRTSDGTTGTFPHVEYNYGVVPNVQLHIIIPYAFSNPTIGSNERGLGDIELGIKYRFAQESKNRPMMGIFPLYLVPTGSSSKGLGAGGYQLFFPLWLEKNWDGWQTNGGGGYWYSHIPNSKNHWFFGWQLQKDISEHITLGGEIFYSTEQVPGQGSSSGFNLGGYYNFDEYNHLLFSAGKGLTNVDATNKFSSYLAYQWTW